jgi:DNA-binding NarL/FixJ family response regulator
MNAPLRLLTIEDHFVFREGLRSLLANHPDLPLVAEAETAEDGVAAANEHQPDVILLDLHLPGRGGLEVIPELLRAVPDVKILVLTMDDKDEAIGRALRLGARGYVLKGAGPDEILSAIRAVGYGQGIVDRRIADRGAGWRGGRATSPFPQLTDRERQILELTARGSSPQAIAGQLGLSLKTVRNHLSNIYLKLQVPDRAAAVARARDAGLLGDSPRGSSTDR